MRCWIYRNTVTDWLILDSKTGLLFRLHKVDDAYIDWIVETESVHSDSKDHASDGDTSSYAVIRNDSGDANDAYDVNDVNHYQDCDTVQSILRFQTKVMLLDKVCKHGTILD